MSWQVSTGCSVSLLGRKYIKKKILVVWLLQHEVVKHSLSMYVTHARTHPSTLQLYTRQNHRSKALCFVFSILRYLHELQYFAIDKISIYEFRKFLNIYMYTLRNQEKTIHLHLKHSELPYLLYMSLHPLSVALNLRREFDIQDISMAYVFSLRGLLVKIFCARTLE